MSGATLVTAEKPPLCCCCNADITAALNRYLIVVDYFIPGKGSQGQISPIVCYKCCVDFKNPLLKPVIEVLTIANIERSKNPDDSYYP